MAAATISTASGSAVTETLRFDLNYFQILYFASAYSLSTVLSQTDEKVWEKKNKSNYLDIVKVVVVNMLSFLKVNMLFY